MKIAIHNRDNSFSDRWIKYCEINNIEFKIVNCYDSEIIIQLQDCDALMWHFNHINAKDTIFAKQLIFALEHAGKVIFPDFKTAWHFDDKVGQKYLLESIQAPFVPSFVFYTKESALDWIKETDFPKVFKLRGGAGSSNVSLVHDKKTAIKIVNRAFGKGFKQYDSLNGLKERWRKYKLGKLNFKDVLKGLARFVYPSEFTKMSGSERGYVYFQKFIEGNDSDFRVIVIDKKAFAIKRMTRENDFRASGSGMLLYNKELFDLKIIRIAFELTNKIQSQCIAYDFIYDNNIPKVVEISYGFSKKGYDACEGYWDRDLNWYPGKFDFCGWMVESVITRFKTSVG
jgi:glutathione synthase/RimK-type ligase-like ATP-grasp enzyme